MQYKFVDNFIKKLRDRDNQRLSSVYTNQAGRTPKQGNSRVDEASLTKRNRMSSNNHEEARNTNYSGVSEGGAYRNSSSDNNKNNMLQGLQEELLKEDQDRYHAASDKAIRKSKTDIKGL